MDPLSRKYSQFTSRYDLAYIYLNNKGNFSAVESINAQVNPGKARIEVIITPLAKASKNSPHE